MSKIATRVVVPFGLLLAIQGGGGLINNLFASSGSWFLLNYLNLPLAVTIAGHVGLLIAGLILLARTKGWRWLLDD